MNTEKSLNILKIALTLFAFTFTAILSGCAPKGDPKQAVDSYFQYIVDGNYDMAYDQLSEYAKTNLARAM